MTLPGWTEPISTIIGLVQFNWLQKLITGKSYALTLDDQSKIFNILQNDNVVILTYKKAHLSTYFIKLAHYILTKQWPTWVHAAANVENDFNNKIQIAESTREGTHLSNFSEVFKCDGVCLLKIRDQQKKGYDEVLKFLRNNLNKKYDMRFKLDDETELSCIEYVYDALNRYPDHEEVLKKLNYLVNKYGNLDPQMLYDSEALEVILEIKR